jgi:uncharacterized repeat protein (TIGR04052 family)
MTRMSWHALLPHPFTENPPMHRRVRRSLVAVGVLAVAACSSDSTAPAGPRDVSIRFRPVVGTQPFVCGQSFANLGTPATSGTVTDFMLYVSDVRLRRADGSTEPVTLAQDGRFQHEDIALLDFASTVAGCPNASADTNFVVRGTAPSGTYTGLQFTLGVPFARNHGDQTAAPSPLNLSRMFWSWNAGYKFVRLDFTSSGLPTGWFVHLGSTTCTPGGGATVIPTACAQPNRVTVTLPTFDAASQVVVADIAALVAGSNLNVNQIGAAGCMSAPTDTDCPPIFQAFGLAFNGGAAPASQTFFRAAAR